MRDARVGAGVGVIARTALGLELVTTAVRVNVGVRVGNEVGVLHDFNN